MATEKESPGSQVAFSIGTAWAQLRNSVQGVVTARLKNQRSAVWQVGWLLAATVIAGGFNYLANVFVGKLLGPEEYGVYAALLALSVILGAPAGVIQTVIANYSARFAATTNNLGRVGTLLLSARRTLLPWALGGVLLIALGSGLLNDFLNISSPVPVIVVGFALLPAVLLPVALGGLQGLQRFGRYGWGHISAGALRLSFSIGMILLGWGVTGALAGGILAGLVTYLIGWWWLRDVHSSSPSQKIEYSEQASLSDQLSRFSAIVILSMVSFTVLIYIDTIAVKSRFLPLEAGLYSAVATIGRIVLYVPTAVVALMFPRVAGLHAQGQSTTPTARKGLLVTLGLCVFGVLAFLALPDFIMGVLFGQQFLGEAALLAPYGIAMLLLALVNVWMLYFLAVQESRYTWILLIGVFVLIAVLFLAPLSLTGVVWALTLCNGGLVLAGELLLRTRNVE